MKFNCPHCGQKIGCKETDAGRATTCPTCKKQLVIPKPTIEPVACVQAVSVEMTKPPSEPPVGVKQKDQRDKLTGFVCPNCGYVGKPKVITKGSIIIELFLWLVFLIPGLIYSIWRLASRSKGCPKCSAENMIPVESPRGRKLIAEFSAT